MQIPIAVPAHPTMEQQSARGEASQENPGRGGWICCSGYKEKDFHVQLIQMNYVKYDKDGGKMQMQSIIRLMTNQSPPIFEISCLNYHSFKWK